MIVFDTETTGFAMPEPAPLAKQPQIIEFAAVKLDDKTLEEVGTISFLCDPGKALPAKITEITGITDADLKGQKPFAAYYPELVEFFLGETTMVAHNMGFDRSLLQFELMRMDKLLKFPWPSHHICTVEASMPIKGHRLKLGLLYEHAFDEKFKDAHRALADTRALVRCVQWLRKENFL